MSTPLVERQADLEPQPESIGAEDAADLQSLREILLSGVGIANDLPADFALNHDHYRLGVPKR